MKIATFNANSLRSRMSIILDWLEKESPDILCIQETKVQDKDFPTSQFDSVNFRSVFKGQKSYNGVAILSRHPWDELRMNLSGVDEQARFISARILGITTINAYVPQGLAPGTDKFDYKLQWLGDLLTLLKRDYDPGLPLLLVGDLNIALEPMDLFDPEGMRGEAGFHEDEQAILREILDWGLIDIFRKHHPEGGHYTFWDYRIPNAFKRRMGWRIDYILATRPLADKSLGVWIDTEPRILPSPSDHTFLVAEFGI